MAVELDEKNGYVSTLPAESPVLMVLLGASNLSRGCFALARHVKVCLYPRKVEVLVASGPGRGYCVSGGLLNVSYPSIQSSDIFNVAQRKRKSGYRVVALVTDIGNDIMYGESAGQVIETVQQIFGKLESMDAEIFYTTLPIAFEKGMNPIWFYILRSVLLPFSRVSRDKAVAEIIKVNQFLRQSSSKHCHLILDMDRYLGFDEIHYGWLRAHTAWYHVAKIILEKLGVNMIREIPLSAMMKSYWEEFRQVVGSDMMGFKKKNPNHY